MKRLARAFRAQPSWRRSRRVQGVHNCTVTVCIGSDASQTSQALSADSPINGLVLGRPRKRRNLVSGIPAAACASMHVGYLGFKQI